MGVIKALDLNIDEQADGNLKLSAELTKDQNRFVIKKRINLARMANQAPDDLPRPSNETSVFFETQAPDENSHFTGFATSVRNPEIILNMIADKANNLYDCDCYIISEHDEEYEQLFFEDEEDEEGEEG